MSRNPRQRTSNQRRRPPAKRPSADLWREPGPLPDIEPVAPANDATALIRSLGEPPLVRGGDVILHVATVIERTAVLATALALSAGVLAGVPATDD